MRSARLLYGVAFAAVVTLLALNWQAQRDTQRRLDRLTGSVVDWSAEQTGPPPIPLAQPDADPTAAPEPGPLPRELNQAKLPAYVIEPPDILTIEVVRVAPLALDPAADGARGVQQISGQHLVRPDGTIGLGSYGSVSVAGMTTAQAKAAVETLLAKHLRESEVTLDVTAFNSKVYYVITESAGVGEQVTRLACTGNETVLDAVANVGGLPESSAKRTMWVSRPAPAAGADRVLPVDWAAITQLGDTTTNYQLLPGDRLYVTATK